MRPRKLRNSPVMSIGRYRPVREGPPYSLAHDALIDEIVSLYSDNVVIKLIFEKETVSAKDAIWRYWANLIGTPF